ncbi:hypothetical protein ACSZNG_03650 [Aeromonas hydrophila]
MDGSYGSAQLNYATGSVLLTLGALPDVNTAILFSWGTPVNYTNRSGQAISIGKSRWQLPHTGITPKSLVLTWGGTKSATDAAGNGTISGDIGGKINYATGEIELNHITLPALGAQFTAAYQYGEPVTERHVEPGRLSTPGQVGHLSITLDGDGGGALNLTPGSVRVKFNALYHAFDPVEQELVIEKKDPIITLQDDGQGNLKDASGVTLGAINYAAGTLHFMPDGSAPLPRPRYAWVTVGTHWVGTTQIATQRWSMVGFDYITTAYTFPDGEQGWVDVTYRNNNSAQAINATLTTNALQIDVTPGYAEAILEGSARFTLGGATYVDRQGLLYRDPDAGTGSGIQAGTIDYSNGVATLSDWAAGASAQPTLQSLATSFAAQSVDAVTFRTPGAPLAPGSLYIAANTATGRRIEATADADGLFTTADMDGQVEHQTGIVTIRFGRLITAAGHETEAWFDPEQVDANGKIWRPISVVADSIRFNCVVYSYLPLDADQIGLDPVRLPSDGRVPFIRKGNVVVVHSTQKAAFPLGVVAGQSLDVGRTRLAYAHVEDHNGKQLAANLYSVNLDSGVVTLASPLNLTGYVEPLAVVHRIEDMSLVTDVEISGRLRLARPLSHDYSAADTHVSSALIIGDLWARYTGLFDRNLDQRLERHPDRRRGEPDVQRHRLSDAGDEPGHSGGALGHRVRQQHQLPTDRRARRPDRGGGREHRLCPGEPQQRSTLLPAGSPGLGLWLGSCQRAALYHQGGELPGVVYPHHPAVGGRAGYGQVREPAAGQREPLTGWGTLLPRAPHSLISVGHRAPTGELHGLSREMVCEPDARCPQPR